MAKRKYRFEKMSQEQLVELSEKFPKAVQTVTIRKPVYSVIAKLLDCSVPVPGIVLIEGGLIPLTGSTIENEQGIKVKSSLKAIQEAQ